MTFRRFTVNWTGWTGGPGYSHLIGAGMADSDIEAQASAINTWLGAIAGHIPNIVKLQLNSQVENLDDSTGQVTDLSFLATQPVKSGTSTLQFRANSGAVVIWQTQTYRNGRAVRGRTFLVPTDTNSYGSDGQLTPTVISDVSAASQALVANAAAGGWFVMSKSGGSLAFVPMTSAYCSKTAAVLRSRRS